MSRLLAILAREDGAPTPGALNVGHGHVIPRPDGVRARCGGPGLCRECSRDLARQRAKGTVDVHVSGSVARVTITADVHKLAEALRAAAEEVARVWPPQRPDAEAAAKPGAEAGRPPLVLIESPYAGDVARNERYARACLADSLARGEAPFASHLLYTQPGVLDDADPAERRQGIEAGLAWGARATLTAVYDDLGITEGMRQGIARAEAEGRPVEVRQLAGWDDPEPARPAPPTSTRHNEPSSTPSPTPACGAMTGRSSPSMPPRSMGSPAPPCTSKLRGGEET